MPRESKSITTIEDPLLEPFFITKDENCYTVNERITPNKHHFRTSGVGKEYSKPQGYYPDFKLALEKITKEKLHTRKNYSLVEFLNEYKTIEINIKDYINEVRSTL